LARDSLLSSQLSMWLTHTAHRKQIRSAHSRGLGLANALGLSLSKERGLGSAHACGLGWLTHVGSARLNHVGLDGLAFMCARLNLPSTASLREPFERHRESSGSFMLSPMPLCGARFKPHSPRLDWPEVLSGLQSEEPRHIRTARRVLLTLCFGSSRSV